jgi:hypothetical protein
MNNETGMRLQACVLRQAQHEESLISISTDATKKDLILSLPKDTPC